jgi:hypothetical protein
MTSLAFVMGVLPLVFVTCAGAEMRRAMGVAVFSGMIGVTAFGVFLTPVFYVVLRRISGNRALHRKVGAGVSLHAPTQVVTGAPWPSHRTTAIPEGIYSDDAPALCRRLCALAPRADDCGCSGLPSIDARNFQQHRAHQEARTATGNETPVSRIARWWKSFDDPVLDHWCRLALDRNDRIQLAAHASQQAQALVRGTDARRSPQIGWC